MLLVLLFLLVVVEAVKIQTDEDLNSFMNESSDSLRNFLVKVATPMKFANLDWNSEMEYMLQPDKFPKAHWAHLRANGVRGMKMTLADSNSVVFDTWPELISLMSNLLAAAKAIGSKL